MAAHVDLFDGIALGRLDRNLGDKTSDEKHGTRLTRHLAFLDMADHPDDPQTALAELRENFVALLELTNLGITLIQSQRIHYVNERFTTMLGFEPEEMLGRPFADFLRPDCLEVIEETYLRHIGGERNMGVFETTLLASDGREVAVELDGGLIDVAGRPTEAVVLRDISARKAAEEAYRILVDTSLQGLVIMQDHLAVFLNSEMELILGYSAEALRAMSREQIERLLHSDDRSAAAEFLMACFREKPTPKGMHFRLIRSDGRPRWVEAMARRVVFRGRPGLQAIFVDVTEKVLAEKRGKVLADRMRQMQRLESLGVLAGGVAHDFNNLLVGILGNSDLLLHTSSPDDPNREMLETIRDAATQAAELTKQMLNYAGKGAHAEAPVDLNRAAHDAVELALAAESTAIEFAFTLAESLPSVDGDTDLLAQMIGALLQNAIEALGDRGGVVRLTTGLVDFDLAELEGFLLGSKMPAGPKVMLQINDTGCGMDEETVGRIFDPFFTTKFTGRGLGLASALGILRAHDAAVRVTSEPGKGSTFTLVFPPPPARSIAEPPPSMTAPPHQPKVLVADDEPMVQATLRIMLQRAGYEVVCAANGREAIERLSTDGPFDTIVLDISMPDMSGEETFAELKKIAPETPIIVCSGLGEREMRQAFDGKAVAGFLGKPFQRLELLHIVGEAMLQRGVRPPDNPG
jgi:PAS domain S-box-containing protein